MGGQSCGDGMQLKQPVGNCAGSAQVLHIKGSWKDGCEKCGNYLKSRGVLLDFTCHQPAMAIQMNLYPGCDTSKKVGGSCCFKWVLDPDEPGGTSLECPHCSSG